MSFLDNVDVNTVQELLTNTDTNVRYFESVSSDVAKAYTEHLDNLMKSIYNDVVCGQDPSIELVEKYFLDLTNTLYFMGEQLEHLGVYDDLAKKAAKEVYNKAYLDNQVPDEKGKKPTVADNQAVAEEASKYEDTVSAIYGRSYKIFKFKIDAGYEMVRSLSKVLNRRIAEYSLPVDNSSRKILNEDA